MGVLPKHSVYHFLSCSADYLMGLRELHCSLARTNPGVPLVVLSVEGDLDASTQAEVESLAQCRLVSPP